MQLNHVEYVKILVADIAVAAAFGQIAASVMPVVMLWTQNGNLLFGIPIILNIHADMFGNYIGIGGFLDGDGIILCTPFFSLNRSVDKTALLSSKIYFLTIV